MRNTFISAVLIMMCYTIIAQVKPEYNGVQAIKELHDGWLIVRLPNFEKKLSLLDDLLEDESLSKKGRKRLIRERDLTMHERDLIHLWYPTLFDSLYSFSRYAFIYMSETSDFQNGVIPARTSTGEPVDSIHLRNYFFATLQGAVGKPFLFTTKDARDITYPFPNRISKSGSIWWAVIPVIPLLVSSLVIDESTKIRAHRHVERVELKLQKMYDKYYPEAPVDGGG